ncbi:hypothetical protein GS534_29635 [Rhodococcus hoagii]|nr:hypothetical protein [Prescottella equi]
MDRAPAAPLLRPRRTSARRAGLGAGSVSWLLTGTVIGHSLDLEPLVAQFRPLARIHRSVLEEAARLFEQQFAPSTPTSE